MILSLCYAASTLAQESGPVHVDRAPLTFRDSGLYASFPARSGGTDHYNDSAQNMLAPQRAAGIDSPWSFYIVQYNYGHNPEPRPSDDLVSLFRQMAANGKKLILRIHIGRLKPNPDVEEMEQILVRVFEDIDPDWVYAITLGEEQIYWNGWGQALEELYHRAKKRWPDLPVYQWWTPMEVPNVRAQSGWRALPADGWVLDLYGQPREVFEKKLLQTLETGKPVIHIAWASPTWLKWSGAERWEPEGRQIMQDQIDVCQAYNVPVAYFCTEPAKTDEAGKRLRGILWGWSAQDPVVRRLYADLEARALNHRHASRMAIGYRTLDQAAFDWAHAWDAPAVHYDVDAQGRKHITWRLDLTDVPVAPGRLPLPTPQSVPRLEAHAVVPDDAVGKMTKGWALASRAGTTLEVPIEFQLNVDTPLNAVIIEAHVKSVPASGGGVALAWSCDGGDWSPPLFADTNNVIRVEIPDQPSPIERLTLRVTLSAKAGVDTSVAALLSKIVLSGAYGPALSIDRPTAPGE